MVRALLFAIVLGAAAPATAEPSHVVYLDVLGKGGMWGLGYEWQATPRFALGGVASFYVLDGDRFATASPYVAAFPIVAGRHRWFVHAGPQLVHRTTPSPGPEWPGMSTTGFAAELSSGYEYHSTIDLRVYAMGSVGEHVVPWLGASIGWTL
jgi:hypothetical protein